MIIHFLPQVLVEAVSFAWNAFISGKPWLTSHPSGVNFKVPPSSDSEYLIELPTSLPALIPSFGSFIAHISMVSYIFICLFLYCLFFQGCVLFENIIDVFFIFCMTVIPAQTTMQHKAGTQIFQVAHTYIILSRFKHWSKHLIYINTFILKTLL